MPVPATDRERFPNTAFINNYILHAISGNSEIPELMKRNKLDHWETHDEFVELIFREMLASELYQDYMNLERVEPQKANAFIIDLYSEIIATNEKLYDYLGDQELTWLDDFPVVNTVIVKQIRGVRPHHDVFRLMPLFKDSDDEVFGKELLEKTLKHHLALSEEIATKTTNWESDRITLIDFVLLRMAVCELKMFPTIPVKVTLNEYLEIAKEYSTPKSSIFINGVLDNIVKEYTDKGTLNKSGRGLM